MSEPTLYRIEYRKPNEPDTFVSILQDGGLLVPVETEEAWLTFEDIGPSAVWIVNHEEQPDYMGADHVLIVEVGDNDGH